MSFLSNLKYRVLGYIFKKQSQANLFRDSLKEVIQDYKSAGQLNLVHLAVEIQKVTKEKVAVLKNAKLLAEHYVITNSVEDAQQLWSLYQRYHVLCRQLVSLTNTQQLLQNEQHQRNSAVTDVLRMQLLNKQHYRTKINMNATPNTRFLARRAMKLQRNQDKVSDLREELNGVLAPNSEEDEEEMESDDFLSDDKFSKWVNSLVVTKPSQETPLQSVDLSTTELESRLKALRQ